jgi:PilZ domain-containing protein
MASKYLDGSMVPRTETRHVDERSEPRPNAQSQTAVLEFRGRKHVVRLVNLSRGGAMLIFSLIPHIGETISIQLIGRRPTAAYVCWVRDGKIGISFAAPVE